MNNFILACGLYLMYYRYVYTLTNWDTLVQQGVITEIERDALEISENENLHLEEHSTHPTHIVSGRLKELEVFGPLKQGFKYEDYARESSPKPSEELPDYFADHNKMQKILNLAKEAQKCNGSLKTKGEELEVVVKDYDHGVDLFESDSQLAFFLIDALEYLQKDDLKMYERVWNLNVLQILQSFLPRGELQAIRLDPKTGPVSRGGLELFFTEGLDLSKPWVKHVSNGMRENFPENDSVIGAIKQAELIVNIRNNLLVSAKLSPTMVEIHDTLLQSRSVSNPDIVKLLTLKSMQHMNGQTTTTQETRSMYHILKHLQTFFPESRKYIATDVKAYHHFEEIGKIIKCQSKLQPHIQKYLKGADVDPYMANLVLRLNSWNFGLNLLKSCLDLLHIQDSALQSGKEERYGLDFNKMENYLLDRDAFIRLMNISKPYIPGLGVYLDEQVKMDKKTGHYKFRSTLLLQTESKEERDISDECPSCLGEFLPGQRLIKLRCFHTHIFDGHCLQDLKSRAALQGKDFECPICETHVELPYTRDQHILWEEPGAVYKI